VQTRESLEAMHDFSVTSLQQAADHRSLAASGENGFSLYANAGVDFGSRKTVDGETGAKISRPYLLGGANYSFGGGSILGLGIGYASGKNTLHGGLGETTGKTVAIELSMSSAFEGSPFVVDAAIGYGWTSYDITRQIPSFSRTATASPGGSSWGGAVKISAPLSASGQFKLTPYGQLDFVATKVDGYTEAGAGSLGLMVPGQPLSNGYAELGLAVGPEAVAKDGGIAPHLQVGWRHAVDRGKATLATRLIGSPVLFNTVMLPAKDGVTLAASIATRVSGGLELSLDYHGLVADPRLSAHAITAGLRYQF
jgi:outer membrane autotransporter protein